MRAGVVAVIVVACAAPPPKPVGSAQRSITTRKTALEPFTDGLLQRTVYQHEITEWCDLDRESIEIVRGNEVVCSVPKYESGGCENHPSSSGTSIDVTSHDPLRLVLSHRDAEATIGAPKSYLCTTVEVPAAGSCTTVSERSCQFRCRVAGEPSIHYVAGHGHVELELSLDDKPYAGAILVAGSATVAHADGSGRVELAPPLPIAEVSILSDTPPIRIPLSLDDRHDAQIVAAITCRSCCLSE
ncbi:MAG TPA: hypothetical protein VH143_14595 [Kofleriaceae bacterium]|jgi:hypothetical protein|nr:hypothetical protein [Kofleriaceae bacterium]